MVRFRVDRKCGTRIAERGCPNLKLFLKKGGEDRADDAKEDC
jgi:hypothetical protein